MFSALRNHWPEYLMEAAELGIFMVSAGLFTALLEYPRSPVHQAIADPALRRALIGVVMGLTAIALIYSPWGQQSGAHMNPAVTLTFWRLGKVKNWDAFFYIAAQFVGGALGVVLVSFSLGNIFAHPAVNYVVTQPGPAGVWVAMLAEVVISCLLMLVVLNSSNSPRLMKFTGIFAGILVALFISFEAPYSGMSINPARTVASAVVSGIWTAWWIYFIAPVLGMLLALDLYRLTGKRSRMQCAKLNHDLRRRCIFCGHHGQAHPSTAPKLPIRKAV